MSRGSYCISTTCYNNKFDKPNVAFFNLPRDPMLAKQWVEIIGRKDLLVDNKYIHSRYQICSQHFSPDQFKKVYPRIMLKSGSLPISTAVETTINFANEISNNGQELKGTKDPHEVSETSSLKAQNSIKDVAQKIKKSNQSRTVKNEKRRKLIGRQKLTTCFCVHNLRNKKASSRARVLYLINESRHFLDKNVHTLFANALKSALVTKYNHRCKK